MEAPAINKQRIDKNASIQMQMISNAFHNDKYANISKTEIHLSVWLSACWSVGGSVALCQQIFSDSSLASRTAVATTLSK